MLGDFSGTHLLDGLSREDERALRLHTDAVLNADSHTPERGWPSFVIWDIYATTTCLAKWNERNGGNGAYGSTVIHCPV